MSLFYKSVIYKSEALLSIYLSESVSHFSHVKTCTSLEFMKNGF